MRGDRSVFMEHDPTAHLPLRESEDCYDQEQQDRYRRAIAEAVELEGLLIKVIDQHRRRQQFFHCRVSLIRSRLDFDGTCDQFAGRIKTLDIKRHRLQIVDRTDGANAHVPTFDPRQQKVALGGPRHGVRGRKVMWQGEIMAKANGQPAAFIEALAPRET